MGSNLNFKNFGMDPSPETGGGGCGRLPSNFPLARQHSIYSLTFDEFQSTVGGIGKDFGSMNMDELLKSIWSAEENQNIGQTSGIGNGVAGGGGGGGGGEGSDYLQRQGSLTLPRTLSQKTVDEVWRDMSKEYDASGSGFGNFSVPSRQPTLGEITLEEFLVRAGVVREEPPQIVAKPNNIGGIFGDLPNNLPLNVNGAQSAAMQPVQPQQQPQLLPKQPALAYGAPMGIQSGNQLSSPRIQGGIGISDQALNNNTMVQNVTTLQGGGLGIVGLGGNGVALGSPSVSSDGLSKSNGDTSSVSPVPFVFNGSLRGRKSSALEKVVERRQRRMIKNRESAARSRARKQAYTMELEAEVAKLKEENEELRKKQAEMLEMQKNQKQEMMHQQNGPKRRCLRRTQTGPW